MITKTHQAVFDMLTENTGVHFLDSGGKDGRHWQRNQNKTLWDFINEKDIEVDKSDPEYPIVTKSLFHHLIETAEYMPGLTRDLYDWIAEDKYDPINNPEGRSNCWSDVEQYMSEKMTDAKIHCVYTYNFDCVLSQDIQYLHFGDDIYDSSIIALSIHNGADARGGLTDYRFFTVDWDQFLNYDPEYYEDRYCDDIYLDNHEKNIAAGKNE